MTQVERRREFNEKNVEDVLALTPMQEGMLFHFLKNPGSDYYFEQLSLEISGKMDKEIFEKAWNFVIETNEILRTVFRWEDIKKPVQMVLKHCLTQVLFLEYPLYNEGKAGEDQDDEEKQKNRWIEEIKSADKKKKFDLQKVPFRVTLGKIEEDRHLLIISNYHILYDGWSNGIILREFFDAYNALAEGDEIFQPPAKTKYKKYVKWIKEQDTFKQKEYWTDYLQGIETGTRFPTKTKSNKGNRRESFHGDSNARDVDAVQYHTTFSHLTSAGFEEFVREYKVTTAALLYTAWGLLLHKYTGQDDVLFGTTVSGRSAKIENIENMVGLFINTLPLRITPHAGSLTGGRTIIHLLQHIKEILRQREIHQCTPLADIKDYSRLPGAEELFNSIIVMENYPLDRGLANKNSRLSLRSYSFIGTPEYDLAIGFLMADAIEVTFSYRPEAITADTIAALSNHLQQIVSYMMAHPEDSVEQVDMLSDKEKKLLLYDFNDTETFYARDKTLHRLFRDQVQKTPDHTAVIFKDNRLTYDRLNRRVNRLANRLKSEGVKPGAIVGILLMPSLERVVAMLAILAAGGAYLPIDPEYPLERTITMLQDCQAMAVISDNNIVDYPFALLKSLNRIKMPVYMTGTRSQITDLDSLPFPDRSLVDYDRYMDKIGQAWVKHCMAIFATRGCPFKCAYCHKIWPKKHVVRSAENIFAEMKLYYQMGVRRFAIIDDIFNLNIENSTRFFQLIIENRMQVQLFFPNGLRGDLVNKEYLDLMVEAGTVSIAFALETASPRLQKLIGKNLNLKKFRENLEYLSENYPQVISELFTMHGFPTETEEEALMTLDFIKSVKIIHFPYINILRIYSNTDMYKLAVENGISEKTIFNWENSYFHELSETLPFDKPFTLKVQSDFLEGYFLSKERLLKVLPYQMKIFSEEEIIRKYSSYMQAEIDSFSDLLKVTGISAGELGTAACLDEAQVAAPRLDEKIRAFFPGKKPAQDALRVLFLDLSQFFSRDTNRLDLVFDPPLGLMTVMTYMNRRFGDRVDGKIIKARIDFDSYAELKTILEEFKPEIIGMRTLTYYRDFFHHTAASIRQWGYAVPIVAGGPYATSNYNTILQDKNIDVVVLGEGEVTFSEIIARMLENGKQFPPGAVLKEIKGLAFVPHSRTTAWGFSREIILLDEICGRLETGPGEDIEPTAAPGDLAYVMFTSGSSGKPKGVMVEHRSVVNNVLWFGETFHLDTHTNLLQLSDYTFDPSVEDIFGALAHGAVLYLSDKDLILDRERFRRFITDNHIHVIDHVPPMLDKLLGEGERLESLRVVITGGMRLEEELKDRLVKKGYPLYNHYGPTEVTVDALFARCLGEGEGVTLGKPIANMRCYIFDRYNHLAPLGVAGELCAAGAGTSRGYLNNPELTARQFVENPAQPGERIYRTGDMARRYQDGNIEFLGRIDQQVKIRGNRVELGEIETQLRQHDNIEAVVLAAKEEQGDIYLCAYVVPRSWGAVTGSQLKDYLARFLPDYMLPAHFILMKTLPLTPGGKIDTRALPGPGNKPGIDLHYMAPVNEIEKKIVALWSSILKLEREEISVTANFFNLGGHSLRAMEVVSHLRRTFEVKIDLKDFINQPSVRFWAQRIQDLDPLKYMAVKPVEKREYYDLSSAQRRLWIICQFEEDSTSYNMVGTFTIAGDFRPHTFERAVQTLVDRHDNFRTVFIYVDGEAKQRILPPCKFTLEQVDLRSTAPLEREQQTRELVKMAANKAFNLETGPLFLFKVLQSDRDQYVLIVNIHHIINDGWSLGIISNEIMTLYNTYLHGGENPLPGLNLQYCDYTAWHNTLIREGDLDRYGDYWLEKYKDKPGGIELPLDHPRPPIQTFNGGRVYFTLDNESIIRLKLIHTELEATLFMKLLTLLTIFLYKYTGQADIMIGAPISGRSNPELYRMIGFLVNTLVYRMAVNPLETYPQLLGNVKQETLACFENQEYPFDLLVERLELDRDLSRSPLFNVMLAFDNTDVYDLDLKMEGITFTGNNRVDDYNPSVFDLLFIMDQPGDWVKGEIMYNSDLFDRSTIERMAANFLSLVKNVLADSNKPIRHLEYIEKEEYETIVYTFNRHREDFQPATIQELVERQVRKSLNSVAVVSPEGWAITYDEINKRANRFAHYLHREYGMGPGKIAGICIERSLEMIIAVLGVVKSGAGYLSFDPNYPKERVQHMIEDSRAGLVIIDRSRPDLFDPREEKEGRQTLLEIHEHWPAISSVPPRDPKIRNELSDVVYIIYTSGSTGTPNGAMLSHALLSNLVQWQSAKTGIDGSLRCLQFTSINFCVSFQEIFITLSSGGEVHLIGDIERQDVDYLMKFLVRRKIGNLYLPFSYLNFLFNLSSETGQGNKSHKTYLQNIVTAGEQLKITSGLKKFLEQNPWIKLHNHYGSSEMHVVTSYTLQAAGAAAMSIPPAGKPIANTRIYILDENERPVPIGVWGELFVDGSHEVLGYIHNPVLTDKKLVWNPVLSPISGHRLYRSGDIGRWQEDGNIELKGRKDFQVKIRGFRVEPSEIESKILALEKVKDCVVVVKEKIPGEKILVAYVVAHDLEAMEIKRHLGSYLPHYMIPKFMTLESLPLMPNGKVDREKLPEFPVESVKPESVRPAPIVTSPREQIKDFDSLPIPDRSLVNYDKYGKNIGLAMVRHTMALQASRGCPYNCLYCHKIWPKKHVIRSAENIFQEVELYYRMGVRRFVLVDDIFNLDVRNSSQFFRMVIRKGLDVHFFFPNGLRSDILTREYIDLMAEGGTKGIGMALESASPRIQRLLKKNLDLDKLHENAEYLCKKHPQIILELFLMHGFPTETEEEAIMTLDFLKTLHWIDFPYLHILKIYPNTDMAAMAMENGVSAEAIARSAGLAFHELPETLPFDKSFTLKYQAEFLGEYFLSKQRLLARLPQQMRILTPEELVEKYDSYLPVEIKTVADVLEFAGIEPALLDAPDENEAMSDDKVRPVNLDAKIRRHFGPAEAAADALRVLLLDLSQSFSDGKKILYDGVEPPLGLMYLLTYLKRELAARVNGKIAKSRLDFDSYAELKALLEEFQPQVIGIRTLTYYSRFFHEVVGNIRRWGITVPIIAGGPYATSDYSTILKDPHVDVVVLSEGELTFARLVSGMIENNGRLPGDERLKEIAGLVFVPGNREAVNGSYCGVFTQGEWGEVVSPSVRVAPGEKGTNLENETEEKLAGIWADLLEVEKGIIRAEDNFFELGGHSLKATIMMTRIHKEFNTQVKLIEIFKSPTIREIARLIQTEKKAPYTAIGQVEAREYYPVSSAQKRMYFLQQIDLHGVGYNMPLFLPIGKLIHRDRIELALKKLIARHENLRTSFEMVNDEPVQRVHDEVEFSIEYIVAAEAEKTVSDFVRPFDVAKAPLMRSGLIRYPDGNYTWVVDLHHIISDGTSQTILAEDFITFYNGGEIEPLKLHYKDFSRWQNRLFESNEIKKQEDYWLELYSGEIPRLELPIDYKRPEVFNFAGDDYVFRLLEEEDALKFRALGTRAGATLYMNILAVLNTLFYKYTGQTDIIIGSGIAGRRHIDLQRIIGMFVNMLAMRNYPQGEKGYEIFLKEVTAGSVKAFENQDVQFDELVDRLEPERDPSRNPLFDISMVVQNFRRSGEIGLEGENFNPVEVLPFVDKNAPQVTYKISNSKFDLTFYVHELEEEIHVKIEYYTGVFKEETVARMATHLKNLVKAVIHNPSLRLKDIAIISPGEQKEILYALNDTAREYPGDKSIDELFEEQVRQSPDCVAVEEQNPGNCSITAITARELNERAKQMANYLQVGKNLRLGEPVGVFLELSTRLPVAYLGILKAGCVYIPLVADYPYQRLKDIIDDAGIGVVISGKNRLKTLNRLQWDCPTFHTFLCVDSTDISSEEEEEKSGLMDEKMWEYIGASAVDEITGGGWLTGTTGQPFTPEEMKEYGDNVLKKLIPILHRNMRVLEIGCASGITMYRIAPLVGFYYGTDLSATIIEKNREKVRLEGHGNIRLDCLAAHEIHRLNEKDFDLVIINSVIQSFHGHNYLRAVLRQVLDLMAPQGFLFIGDVMDRDLKGNLLRYMLEFSRVNVGKDYRTKTDWSEELFISRAFFEDLTIEFPGIHKVEFSDKIYSIENELTLFRYDTLLSVDKKAGESKQGMIKPKHKYQEDAGVLHRFNTEQPQMGLTSAREAYVIYTSGTTGRPKGVMVEHGSVVRLVKNSNFMEWKEGDRLLPTGSIAFDLSTFEIWGPLLNGVHLVLVEDKAVILNGKELEQSLHRHKVTHLHLIPQLFEQLAEERPAIFARLVYFLVGGDRVRPRWINKIREKYRDLKILHMYGPTENTTFSTFYPVDNKFEEALPIGRPVANSFVYILDKYRQLQPVGVYGELCTGGRGVARGYLNQPELTAEKFFFFSYRSTRLNRSYLSQRLYQTGDIARWNSEGQLEFAGRIDRQVKIRGIRIETAEIESRLLSCRDIKDAVVMARSSENGDLYLCAYIVPREEGKKIDLSDLGLYLGSKLPGYMMPSMFITLERLPLTTSGKVDQKFLPEPKKEMTLPGYTPPGNPIEEKLVEIWGDILGIERSRIGIDANFFQVGGHSLKATVLANRIHKELDVQVPLLEIFKNKTIRELCRYIQGASRSKFCTVEPVEKREFYALSSAQTRMYVIHRLEPASTAYSLNTVLKLEGQQDRKKLEKSMAQMIKRHESFRTSFEVVNGLLRQRIHQHVEFTAEYYMYEEKDGGKDDVGNVDRVIKNFIRPFDLSRAPLVRAGLIKINEQEHIFMSGMHHIIGDGISNEIMIGEIMKIYLGEKLPELKIQYKDFAQWQNRLIRSGEMKKQEEYWLRQFQGKEPQYLPTDFPRSKIPGSERSKAGFQLSPEDSTILRELAIKENTTMFMVMVTLVNILLFKISDREDITVGTVIAGRRHADLQNIVGFFVNTLVLRNYPGSHKRFGQFLKEVKERTLEAYENQDYQFEELVEKIAPDREAGRNPLFDVMFTYSTQEFLTLTGERGNNGDQPDVKAQSPGTGNGIQVNFDMVFSIQEFKHGIYFSIGYNIRLFKKETIEKFLEFFKIILSTVKENNSVKIGDIKISYDLRVAAADVYEGDEIEFE